MEQQIQSKKKIAGNYHTRRWKNGIELDACSNNGTKESRSCVDSLDSICCVHSAKKILDCGEA